MELAISRSRREWALWLISATLMFGGLGFHLMPLMWIAAGISIGNAIYSHQ